MFRRIAMAMCFSLLGLSAWAHDAEMCTTKGEGIGVEGNGAYLKVTNLCDGHTLLVTITPLTQTFTFSCSRLRFVQPHHTIIPHYLGYEYAGHGYAFDLDERGYVSLHQPGNTTGVCHDLSIDQTRTFRVSVHPERVDNARPLNFLKPFQVYYGMESDPDDDYGFRLTERQLLMAFP